MYNHSPGRSRRLLLAGALTLGLIAPKTVLAESALLMLPNGKPDRLAMTRRLNALHQGK